MEMFHNECVIFITTFAYSQRIMKTTIQQLVNGVLNKSVAGFI